MTDPRFTAPRHSDPAPVNSNLRGDRGNAAMWGWVAGIAVVILIAFILTAGWNGNTNTASNPPAATTGSATAPVPPRSTTGQGTSAPAMAPQTPAPSAAPTTK